MAWFADLAGKAENLLNKMDQTAADTLHSTGLETSSNSKPASRRSTLAAHRRNVSGASDVSAASQPTFSVSETWTDLETDSEMRRSSSHQDVKSMRQKKRSVDLENETASDNGLRASKSNLSSGIGESLSLDGESGAFANGVQTNVGMGSSDSLVKDAYYRENLLLKNELQGLKRESANALSRAKRAEQDLQKLRNQISTERQHAEQENRTKETEFITALKAKDSQIAHLRIQLEETDARVRTLQEQPVESLRNPSGDLLEDERLVSLQQKITDLEESIAEEREQSLSLKNQMTNAAKIREDQIRELSVSLKEAESQAMQQNALLAEVNKERQALQTESEDIRKELTEYKAKASAILQSKDELIRTLKESGGQANDEQLSQELSDLSAERDMLRQEISSLQSRLDSTSLRSQEKESLLTSSISKLQSDLREARSVEANLRRDISALEISLKARADELEFMQAEFNRKEATLQAKMKERDIELNRLRQVMLTKPDTRPSDSELEGRMRVLTDNLIQKQTTIETLQTERNSLIAQMERLEKRLRAANRTPLESRIDMTPTQSVQREESSFLFENSNDGNVARRIKRAYSTVDKFSFRLGTFLRRYPIARVMVLGYMFFLHFWVLIVLLTYTPETHVSDKPMSG